MSSLAQQKAKIGQPVAPTPWQALDQQAVQKFADLTGDQQFIHIDPAAAAKTVLDGPIVHGFFTLSLIAPMAAQVLDPLPDQLMALNYGFDKVRFLSPVPVGARIRGHFTLQSVEERSEGHLLHSYRTEIEIEHHKKPALVADWLYLIIFD